MFKIVSACAAGSGKGVFAKISFPEVNCLQVATMKLYKPPVISDRSEWPEVRKLRQVERIPSTVVQHKPYKMMRRLILMRGPEPVHNFLLYKQYGIQALIGGRMKYEHFENVRQTLFKKMDEGRMFTIWRVDPPWQSVTRKGQGKRMGSGKGSIDHYVSPVKAGRIIVELAGDLCEEEAIKLLNPGLQSMPFRAQFVSQRILDEQKAEEEYIEKNNINPYTFEYILANNLGGCNHWCSPYDYKWHGKHQ